MTSHGRFLLYLTDSRGRIIAAGVTRSRLIRIFFYSITRLSELLPHIVVPPFTGSILSNLTSTKVHRGSKIRTFDINLAIFIDFLPKFIYIKFLSDKIFKCVPQGCRAGSATHLGFRGSRAGQLGNLCALSNSVPRLSDTPI